MRDFLISKFKLPGKEAEGIAGFFEETLLPKNEFFVSEGSVEKSSAILMEGLVRYFAYDSDGNDPTCYFSFENHILMDPFTYRKQVPATLNIVSVCDCRLGVLSYESEKKLNAAYPQWASMANDLLLEVSIEFADQKSMTNMNAGERYEFFAKKYPHVLNRAPLQYVASYLGVTQPSLSRLRRNLVKKKS